MKTLILFLLVSFLMGCSKDISNYTKTTSPVFQDKEEIQTDEAAFLEGPQIGIEEKNHFFSNTGKDYSRGGGNLFFKGDLNILWENKIGNFKSSLNPFESNLVAFDDKIFVLNSSGELNALNSIDGKILWKTKIGNAKETKFSAPRGLAVDEKNIYSHFGSFKINAHNFKNGEVLWENEFRYPIVSGPIVSSEGIFLTLIDGSSKFLNKFNGDILWSFPSNNNIGSNVFISYSSINDDFVVIPTSTNQFSVVDIYDGSFMWNDGFNSSSKNIFEFSNEAYSFLDEDNLYFANNENGIVSFNSSLELMNWEILLGVDGLPWMSGNSLFFISKSGFIICIRKKDGKIRWKYKLPKDKDTNNLIKYFGPLVLSGQVFTINENGKMILLNSYDGTLILEKEIKGSFSTEPIIFNGKLILVSDNGRIFSFS